MKIILGTAQFGMDYGVSNARGKADIAEVKVILSIARRRGVDILDTAPGYGSSEDVLGESARDAFDFITKTIPLRSAGIGPTELARVRSAFQRSLERLRRDSVYAILVHHADDLLQPGGEQLADLLDEFVAQGLARVAGVSVYNWDQLARILERWRPGLVQCPLNVFDQRMVRSGGLARLRALGVEVHARSVFLQGLLLMAPQTVPAYFAPYRGLLEAYHRVLGEYGLGALDGAAGYVASAGVDAVVVGVAAASQLEETLDALGRQPAQIEYERFATDDARLVEPHNWRLGERAVQRSDA